MAKPVLIALIMLSSARSAWADEKNMPLRFMTFNIRYGTADDGENAWPHRRELVFETIRAFDPDVLGVQEALRMQLDELADEFPQYASVGPGREADGAGEYAAILFRRKQIDVCSADTFWLSDTPNVPNSTSWGNQSPRICTWTRLLDRETGRRFQVYNTHWDNESQSSREQSGRWIAERIATQQNTNEPVIVMGDFNAGEANPARVALEEAGLRDTFRDLHPEAPEVGTFNGFAGRTSGKKIDAVLASEHWITTAAQIDRTQQAGRFPSDHFPVTAVLELVTRSVSKGG